MSIPGRTSSDECIVSDKRRVATASAKQWAFELE